MIQHYNNGHPIVQDDIVRLEKYLGYILPFDYKEYQLLHNGGRIRPSFTMSGDPIYPIKKINLLYGVVHSIDACTIRWNYDIMKDRMRPQLLPIGDNGGPDLFCLVLYGPNYGKIVFWDCREMWLRPPPDPLHVYPVAESFTDFLNGLFDDDPLPNNHPD